MTLVYGDSEYELHNENGHIVQVFRERRSGLVAQMQKNSERQRAARGKGPEARVAHMTITQRWNELNKDQRRRVIRPL